jgi:hypothetical protein
VQLKLFFDLWVYERVGIYPRWHILCFITHLPISVQLFLIQGVELTNESYTGEQVEHIEIQSALHLHEREGSRFVASGVRLELLSKAG